MNTADTTMLQHPASFEIYIKHGWKLVPIPKGTKSPVHRDWNKEEYTIDSLDKLRSVPDDYGMGLAHAYSNTMALDIDNWERAKEELKKHKINLDALYNAHDAVIIDSGRKGHGKLLYKLPADVPIKSAKLTDVDHTGQRYNYLDFRCATKTGLTVQDVLPPSIHPDTREPYRWSGRGDWRNLPVIPPALLNMWLSLNKEDEVTHKTTVLSLNENIEWDDVRRALSHISPDIDRDSWVHVGMALHHAGVTSDCLADAFELWNEWSSKSKKKYKGEKDLLNVWRSFNANEGITLGTLFAMAIENGYHAITPETVQKMFSDVNKQKKLSISELINLPRQRVDPDLFPPVIRDYAMEVTNNVGCDPMMPLFTALTVVATAIDSRSRLRIRRDFDVPSMIWVMNIAGSGSKKSPSTAPFIKALSDIDDKLNEHYDTKMRMYQKQLDEYNKLFDQEMSLIPDGKDDSDLLIASIANKMKKPEKPKYRRLILRDTSSQKMISLMVDSPQGMMLYLDEAITFLSNILNTSSTESRSSYMDGYNGGSSKVDRIGRETDNAEHVGLCIYANVQPDVLGKTVSNLGKDGFIQRFIPITPDPMLEFVPDSHLPSFIPHDYQSPAERNYRVLLNKLVHKPYLYYSLSEEAYEKFHEYEKWIDEYRKLEVTISGENQFCQALSKMTGLLGRLSLIFYMSEPDNDSVVIPACVVDNAMKLIKTFIIPSYRLFYTEYVGDNNRKLLEKIVNFIIEHSAEQSFTYSQLNKSMNNYLTSVNITNSRMRFDLICAVMTELEIAGWVKVVDESAHNKMWIINHAINEQFKERKERLLEAKRKMKEKFLNIGSD